MLSTLASVISVEKSGISFMIVPLNLMCPSPTPLTPHNVAFFKISLSMNVPECGLLCIQIWICSDSYELVCFFLNQKCLAITSSSITFASFFLFLQVSNDKHEFFLQ